MSAVAVKNRWSSDRRTTHPQASSATGNSGDCGGRGLARVISPSALLLEGFWLSAFSSASSLARRASANSRRSRTNSSRALIILRARSDER